MRAKRAVLVSLLSWAPSAVAATTSSPTSTITSSTAISAGTSQILSPSSATVTLTLSNNTLQTVVVPVEQSPSTSFQTSSTPSSTTSLSTSSDSSSSTVNSQSTSATLSQAAAIPDPLPAIPSSTIPTPSPSRNLTTPTRIGLGISIGIGVPILLLLIAILFILIRRSRKQHRDLTEIDQKLAEPTNASSRPETAADIRGGAQAPAVAELEGTQVQVPVVVNNEEPTFSNDAHWKRILEERLETLQIGKKRISEIEDDETVGMRNRFSGATEDDPRFQRISRYSDPESRVRSFRPASTSPTRSEGDRLQIPRFPSPYPNDPDLLGYGRMSPSRQVSQRRHYLQQQRTSAWSDEHLDEDDDEPRPLQFQRQRSTKSSSTQTDGSLHSHLVSGLRSRHWSDEIQPWNRYTTFSEEDEANAAAAAAVADGALQTGEPSSPTAHRQPQHQERRSEEDLERAARWSYDAKNNEDLDNYNHALAGGGPRSSGVTATTRVQTLSSLDSEDLRAMTDDCVRTVSSITQDDMNRWQHYGSL